MVSRQLNCSSCFEVKAEVCMRSTNVLWLCYFVVLLVLRLSLASTNIDCSSTASLLLLYNILVVKLLYIWCKSLMHILFQCSGRAVSLLSWIVVCGVSRCGLPELALFVELILIYRSHSAGTRHSSGVWLLFDAGLQTFVRVFFCVYACCFAAVKFAIWVLLLQLNPKTDFSR